MEHLVTFKTAEGREGNHTADSLDEALRFVERLYNNEEASGVRLFRLQEVPIEFRTYTKVEVGNGKASSPTGEDGDAADEPAADSVPTSSNGETDSVEGSRRIFNRS